MLSAINILRTLPWYCCCCCRCYCACAADSCTSRTERLLSCWCRVDSSDGCVGVKAKIVEKWIRNSGYLLATFLQNITSSLSLFSLPMNIEKKKWKRNNFELHWILSIIPSVSQSWRVNHVFLLTYIFLMLILKSNWWIHRRNFTVNFT